MRRVVVIPAYQAESTIEDVVLGARECFDATWVIDDGSTDATGELARGAGARVIRLPHNRGKAAALRTALDEAAREGLDAIVTIDADGQHPPAEAARLDTTVPDREALVLGVRDLVSADAPRANRRGNSISNYWLSLFAGRPLADTQCGMRRYPVAITRALAPRGERFTFESEVVLRAALRGVRIVEVSVKVLYPPERRTHFRVVKDPTRIVGRVVSTVIEEQARRVLRRGRG
jgi:glycosyltransferase involved in cell wall biosynthesis